MYNSHLCHLYTAANADMFIFVQPVLAHAQRTRNIVQAPHCAGSTLCLHKTVRKIKAEKEENEKARTGINNGVKYIKLDGD